MAETIRARLMAAMAEMDNPKKSETVTVPAKGGGKYSYRYETLEQLLEIVRPALMAHGLGLTQGVRRIDGTWSLVTSVFDGEDSLALDERPMRDFPGAQDAGSWETYMRRYALRSAFGLCGEDDDGAAAQRASKPKPKAAQIAPKPRQKPETEPEHDQAPAQDALKAAKAELWEACKGYAEAHGRDPGAVAAGCRARIDYEDAPDWYLAVAEELRSET
jgi:hypothetical protein